MSPRSLDCLDGTGQPGGRRGFWGDYIGLPVVLRATWEASVRNLWFVSVLATSRAVVSPFANADAQSSRSVKAPRLAGGLLVEGLLALSMEAAAPGGAW